MLELQYGMLLESVANLVISTIGSGAVVSMVTEILKSKVIPIPAERYPRTVAWLLSIGVAWYTSYNTNIGIIIDTWQEVIFFGVAILLIATNCYHVVVKGILNK